MDSFFRYLQAKCFPSKSQSEALTLHGSNPVNSQSFRVLVQNIDCPIFPLNANKLLIFLDPEIQCFQ